MTKSSARSTHSTTLLSADAGLIVGLGLVAAWPLADAYGGERWAVAVVAGLACGVVIALLARRLHAGVGLTASATFVVYLLIGPAVAVPQFASAGFGPNWATLQVLLTGAVEVWGASLILVAPLGSAGTVLIVPWVLGLVAGVSAGFLLWRTRFEAGAPLVLVLLFFAASAYGDAVTRFTVTRGLLLVIGLVVWARWRSQRHVQDRWARRVAWTAAVVLIASLGGVAAASLAGDADRAVLREYTTPHFDPRDHPSPLSRLRALASGEDQEILFGVIGVEPGDRIRLATMVYFDGQVWNVSGGAQAPEGSGQFRRLPGLARAGYGEGVIVTVVDYRGVWIPSVGEPLGLDVVDEVENIDQRAASRTLTNTETGTVAQVEGARWGQSYHFRYTPGSEPGEEEIADAAAGDAPFPEPASVPDALVERAEDWIAAAGDPTGGALAQTLADGFADEGFYSDGGFGETRSTAGHGTRRLTEFAQGLFMVGNDEQYAAAMALVAQHFGLPARVVVGFEISDEDGDVRAADTKAWTEVNLAGHGWVAFDPTPPVGRRLDPAQGDLSQLPPPPERPDREERVRDSDQDRSTVARAAETSLRWLLIVIVVVAGTFVLVAGVKAIRRRRRRGAAAPGARFSGGWREITDRARDLGTPIPVSHTRRESSAVLSRAYPDSGVSALAATADEHLFGVTEPTDAELDAYWADVDTALKRMRQAAPWWRTPLAWCSPASLLRRE